MISPLAHEPDLASVSRERVEAVMTVDPQEPVLAGHYPGFPIFPGVCIVECVHRTALAASIHAGLGLVELAAVESTRLIGPVYPDDGMRFELVWDSYEEQSPRCRATVFVGENIVARVRLRFRRRKINGLQ